MRKGVFCIGILDNGDGREAAEEVTLLDVLIEDVSRLARRWDTGWLWFWLWLWLWAWIGLDRSWE